MVNILLACLVAATPRAEDLQALYDQNRFFELRDELAASPPSGLEASFFQGVAANRFGAYAASDEYLNKYLEQTGPLKNRQAAILALADSAVKECRYAKAAEYYDKLLAAFGEKLSVHDAEDYRNVGGMWRALANTPAQTAVLADTTISARRGIIQQWPIGLGDKTQHMILDTGANFSVIRRSLAESFGFRLVQTTVMVSGITGAKTPAVLGVAPELKIGSAIVKNAVFLVFEDEALNVGGGLQLDGIIGYPVISALGRVTFSRSGEFSISTGAAPAGSSNLCVDWFSMIVEGRREDRRLVFQLDTGASRTALYPPFLAKFRDSIEKDGKPVKDGFSGVGGATAVDAYELESLGLELGGKRVTLPKARVHRAFSSARSREIDGNIGNDVIGQFEKMTLDFRAMQMTFE